MLRQGDPLPTGAKAGDGGGRISVHPLSPDPRFKTISFPTRAPAFPHLCARAGSAPSGFSTETSPSEKWGDDNKDGVVNVSCWAYGGSPQ